MFKDNVGEEDIDSTNSWMPRCSITTLLYRIAFTVLHATFFLERQSVVTMVFMFALEFFSFAFYYFLFAIIIGSNFGLWLCVRTVLKIIENVLSYGE